MELEKLKILVEVSPDKFEEKVEALFNPNQITIQKSINLKEKPTQGSDVPGSQFTHGNPATLSMDLFFDTYGEGSDVRKYTDEILHLATIEKHGEIHRPPVCQLLWGESGVFFQGILQSLSQRFTLFLGNGWPARATLGCSFKEWRTQKEDEQRTDKQSVDVAKSRVVKRGDTLSSIAGEEYNDPALWRPIAAANGIENPRILTPGDLLAIPALTARSAHRPGGA